jgi:hypothetical protein
MSVRVDPLALILDGKLGIELEVAVLKWMTAELVPVFIVDTTPPTFGYLTGPHGLKRESNGWGPLAGTSIDVGFWLEGKAMNGNVVRLIYTNYAYEYTAPLDRVSHVERQIFGYFGSQSRWGAFTIAGGLGIGTELNRQRRCYYPDNPMLPPSQWTYHPSSQCDTDALFLRVDKVAVPGVPPPVVDLSGGLGGVQFLARLSLGVVF